MKKNLKELGFRARSGDKGDTVDLSVFAPDEQLYEVAKAQINASTLKDFFKDIVKGEIRCYYLPKLKAIKIVLENALAGGAAESIRFDNLGKCFGGNILRFKLTVEE